jgi:hypothetical protein
MISCASAVRACSYEQGTLTDDFMETPACMGSPVSRFDNCGVAVILLAPFQPDRAAILGSPLEYPFQGFF